MNKAILSCSNIEYICTKNKNMSYNIEILYSVIVLIIMLVVVFFTKRAITKFTFVKSIEIHRRRVISNISYITIYCISAFILISIWGVDLKRFTIFISSILAVLGVAFVAQWSILSNLTASVILFFSHPVRIGHRIRILEKDYEITGQVTNITGFFFYIRTDKNENITLPNIYVIQKGIEILSDQDEDMF